MKTMTQEIITTILVLLAYKVGYLKGKFDIYKKTLKEYSEDIENIKKIK